MTDTTTTALPVDHDAYLAHLGTLTLAAHLADDRATLVTVTDQARSLWQAAGDLADRAACDAVVAIAIGRLSDLDAAAMHDA